MLELFDCIFSTLSCAEPSQRDPVNVLLFFSVALAAAVVIGRLSNQWRSRAIR
jgi:hypothetical protein